ncbi:uncharacterized protein [Miscanthus floridulus]|uniref:uncharacterized protein n=1 Tax=Miscanthus floridulus TaxID=154761 RepID=UPI00345803CA
MECWTMYFDGSLMKSGTGAGLLFVSPLRIHTRYMVRLHFATSNNAAEYEALINGLQIAIELGVRRLDIQGNSQLVIDQVMKESNCLDPKMEAYCKMVGDLVLRLTQSNKGHHKLTPPWEGPYIVAQVLKPEIYKLDNEKGEIFTNAWNIE